MIIEQSSKIRLFLVDDEPVVCKGLELFLEGQPNLEVCGQANNSTEAMALIPQLDPDLAVIDLRLKGGNGLELLRRLHQLRPELKLLVFSMHNQLSLVRKALDAGAQGYVAKDEGGERVLEAIQALMAGRSYVTPAMAARLSAPRSSPESGQE